MVGRQRLSAGQRIARGENLHDLEADGLTAEGIQAVERIFGFASEHGIDLPICSEVYRVVFRGKPAADAIRALMERSAKPEATV